MNTKTNRPQISLEKLVDHIFKTTDTVDRVGFYAWVLSGGDHVQHRQCLALAKAAGVTPETARNWLVGNCDCPKAGLLYALSRAKFRSEDEMARCFGEFINRDLIKEIEG